MCAFLSTCHPYITIFTLLLALVTGQTLKVSLSNFRAPWAERYHHPSPLGIKRHAMLDDLLSRMWLIPPHVLRNTEFGTPSQDADLQSSYLIYVSSTHPPSTVHAFLSHHQMPTFMASLKLASLVKALGILYVEKGVNITVAIIEFLVIQILHWPDNASLLLYPINRGRGVTKRTCKTSVLASTVHSLLSETSSLVCMGNGKPCVLWTCVRRWKDRWCLPLAIASPQLMVQYQYLQAMAHHARKEIKHKYHHAKGLQHWQVPR